VRTAALRADIRALQAFLKAVADAKATLDAAGEKPVAYPGAPACMSRQPRIAVLLTRARGFAAPKLKPKAEEADESPDYLAPALFGERPRLQTKRRAN
jgi:hypothetical protein